MVLSRQSPITWLRMDDKRIRVQNHLKYLGLLDDRLDFTVHFSELYKRSGKAITFIGRLLPNKGGPGTHVRRLYNNTIRSMVMYGVPMWANKISKKGKSTILSIQNLWRCVLSRRIVQRQQSWRYSWLVWYHTIELPQWTHIYIEKSNAERWHDGY